MFGRLRLGPSTFDTSLPATTNQPSPEDPNYLPPPPPLPRTNVGVNLPISTPAISHTLYVDPTFAQLPYGSNDVSLLQQQLPTVPEVATPVVTLTEAFASRGPGRFVSSDPTQPALRYDNAVQDYVLTSTAIWQPDPPDVRPLSPVRPSVPQFNVPRALGEAGTVQRPNLVPKEVKLDKPPTFDGNKRKLENFVFVMRQYIDSVGLGDG